MTGSRPWPPGGSPTPTQFGVVITGEDGRIQGFQEKPDPAEALSDLANCGIYMFRSEIFDFFPALGTSAAAGEGDPPGFADWAMDVFPALLEGDVPFYSHEAEAYWNDIGNMAELRQGNLDAVGGAVELERGAPEVAEGVWSASDLDGVEVGAPALIGVRGRVRRGRRDRRARRDRRRVQARRRRLRARRDPARAGRAPRRGDAGRRRRGRVTKA